MSNDQKRTLKINPAFFNMSGGHKTKKNREMSKPQMIINQSTLKTQFLNRIKAHKNKEKQHTDNKISLTLNNKIAGQKGAAKMVDDATSSDAFSDEFYDSINYLNSISKKNKEDAVIIKKKQVMRDNLAKTTIKNHNALNAYNSNGNAMNTNVIANTYNDWSQHTGGYNIEPSPHVELDLPMELQESFAPPRSMPMVMNYAPPQVLPYGCLKGGQKPTYRTWNATRKNYDVLGREIHAPEPEIVQALPSFGPETTDRERKLDLLKQKMMQKQAIEKQEKIEKMLITQKLIQNSNAPQMVITEALSAITEPLNNNFNMDIGMNSLGQTSYDFSESSFQEPSLATIIQEKKETDEINSKKLIKRTVRRKYTLGKSTVYRKVGVLMKDKNTRKKILSAQKDLKMESIVEVKRYLKEHGLIKVGSCAPNDVIRKTYEAAMLTGEIVNNNKDTLLHNFLSDTKE